MNATLYARFTCILVCVTFISPELAFATKSTHQYLGFQSRLTIERHCAFQGGIADGTRGTGTYGCAGGRDHPNCAIGCSAKGECWRDCGVE
jgi:hypothetical protein